MHDHVDSVLFIVRLITWLSVCKQSTVTTLVTSEPLVSWLSKRQCCIFTGLSYIIFWFLFFCIFFFLYFLWDHCTGGSRIPCKRGSKPSGGAPTYDFVKISEKLHEIEKILGCRGGRPPKSATALIPLFCASGDVSSGFQSQSGQPYSHFAALLAIIGKQMLMF